MSLKLFEEAYRDLRILKYNKYLKMCVFNQNTNPKTDFTIDLDISDKVMLKKYDETDLMLNFYQAIEQLHSIGFDKFEFSTNVQSALFHNFLIPGLVTMTQNIKDNLSILADNTINKIKTIITFTYVVESIILIISFTIAVYKITSIIQSFIIMI